MLSSGKADWLPVVDGLTSPATGYTANGVQPGTNVPPSAPSLAQQQVIATNVVPPVPSAKGPTVVADFPNSGSGGIVIDYRDPDTNQVLVQVPMRTALAQFVGANAVPKIGRTVDTEA